MIGKRIAFVDPKTGKLVDCGVLTEYRMVNDEVVEMIFAREEAKDD